MAAETTPDTDELLARLAQLEARIAELEQQPDPTPPPDPSRFSRRALFGLAGAGIVGTAIGASATPAAAADGDPLLLGQENTSLTLTTMSGDGNDVLRVVSGEGAGGGPGVAIDAAGAVGVQGTGEWSGLQGHGDGYGVLGSTATESGFGVFGSASEGSGSIGVAGDSSGYLGVAGSSGSGIGGAFASETGPQVWLFPPFEGPTGPPADFNVLGALHVDPNGDMFLCTADAEPGTWTRLNQQGPRFLPTPARGYDSRPSFEPTTGPQGRFAAGETRTVDLSATGIPAGTTGILVNVAVTGTSGSGFVSIGAGDAVLGDPPTFSAINWTESGQTTSNTTAVRVHDGTVKVYAHRATHMILDVIAAYA